MGMDLILHKPGQPSPPLHSSYYTIYSYNTKNTRKPPGCQTRHICFPPVQIIAAKLRVWHVRLYCPPPLKFQRLKPSKLPHIDHWCHLKKSFASSLPARVSVFFPLPCALEYSRVLRVIANICFTRPSFADACIFPGRQLYKFCWREPICNTPRADKSPGPRIMSDPFYLSKHVLSYLVHCCTRRSVDMINSENQR